MRLILPALPLPPSWRDGLKAWQDQDCVRPSEYPARRDGLSQEVSAMLVFGRKKNEQIVIEVLSAGETSQGT